MFGWIEAGKLEKIKQDVKGANLVEVVEAFANSELILSPNLEYDPDIASKLAKCIEGVDAANPKLLQNALQSGCRKNKFPEEAIHMGLAKIQFESLKWASLDLAAASKACDLDIKNSGIGDTFYSKQFADYCYSTWAKSLSLTAIVPILFIPVNLGQSEDFGIEMRNRETLIDAFFNKRRSVIGGFEESNNMFNTDVDRFYGGKRSVDGFKRLMNSFAVENPYFRNYPNV